MLADIFFFFSSFFLFVCGWGGRVALGTHFLAAVAETAVLMESWMSTTSFMFMLPLRFVSVNSSSLCSAAKAAAFSASVALRPAAAAAFSAASMLPRFPLALILFQRGESLYKNKNVWEKLKLWQWLRQDRLHGLGIISAATDLRVVRGEDGTWLLFVVHKLGPLL